MQEQTQKTALVIGATGLVGKELMQLLLNDDEFAIVKTFGRRSNGINHSKLQEYIVDFENLPVEKITGDVMFNCMGTTLKQAGNKEMQFKADVEYPVNFAKLASENKVPVAIIISAPGADEKSLIFYSRLKGQLEKKIKELPFDFIRFIHPSILSGERAEPRFGEKFLIGAIDGLSKVFPFFRKYKSISGLQVANALIYYYKNLGNERVKTLALEELFV